MRNLQAASYFALTGGMDDQSDAIELPNNKFQDIVNMMVQRDSLVKRGGYENVFATALEGGSAIQSIFPYVDNSMNRRLIEAVNGKLYRDAADGTQPTDITGGLTLSTERDAIFDWLNYDGQIIGTDQTNGLFRIPDVSSSAVVLDTGSLSDPPPSVARVVGLHKEHMLLGDINDTDGVRYPYRVLWNNPPYLDQWPRDRFNDLNRDQKVVAFYSHGQTMLIFQNRSIWQIEFTVPTGVVQTEFNFQQLDARIGSVGLQSIVSTNRGTWFLGDKGPYWIPPGPPRPPLYVGRPVESFWTDVNKARLEYAVGCEIPEKNGVVFFVPYGENQVNNNKGLFFNYEEISRIGRDLHPAFSIWEGEAAQPLEFNSACTAVLSSRGRPICGRYNGLINKLDEGTADIDQGISSTFKTPFYSMGDRAREKMWYTFGLDVDLETKKTVTVRVRLFNDTYPQTITETVGTLSDPLGSFVLGTSALGFSDLGRLTGDLKGRSRYIELLVTVGTDQEQFALHGVQIHYKSLARWS